MKYLNSRDPEQSFVAFKVALSGALAPLEELDYAIELKRAFYADKGGLTWSFLLFSKGRGLVFNLSTDNS